AAFQKAQDIARTSARENPTSERPLYALAVSLHGSALVRIGQDDFEKARSELVEAETVSQRLVDGYPKVITHRRILASFNQALGSIYGRRGKPAAGLAPARRARDLKAALVREEPAARYLREDLFGCLVALSRFALKAGQPAESLESLAQAREAFGALGEP